MDPPLDLRRRHSSKDGVLIMEKKTGVFYDISNEEYHAADDIVSRSYLHSLRNVPAASKVTKKTTGAMEIGTAMHMRVLEPHRFAAEVMESEFKRVYGGG